MAAVSPNQSHDAPRALFVDRRDVISLPGYKLENWIM